jgi:hypothetical protein
MMGLLIIGINPYLTAKLGARKKQAGACTPALRTGNYTGAIDSSNIVCCYPMIKIGIYIRKTLNYSITVLKTMGNFLSSNLCVISFLLSRTLKSN